MWALCWLQAYSSHGVALQILILPRQLQGSEQGTYGCTAAEPTWCSVEAESSGALPISHSAPLQLVAGEGWD